MSGKIDFVITWVDGNEPKWRAEFNNYAELEGGDKKTERYRDFDILKYWFRSIEKNAPWVNNIYFVTWGHLPEFLNIEHPKLKIVKHTEFIPAEYLPTFNSNCIDLHLHKIPGLSENFVYFNDDMFLNKPLKADDFFCNNLIVDKPVLSIDLYYEKFSYIMFKNTSLVNKHYDKRKTIFGKLSNWFNLNYAIGENISNLKNLLYKPYTGLVNHHGPLALKKSLFEEYWTKDFDEFHDTSRFRFRQYDSINIFVLRFLNLASNNFIPSKSRNYNFFYSLSTVSSFHDFKKISNHYDCVCLNDDQIPANEFEALKKEIHQYFEEQYPEKSLFEI